MRSIQSLPIRRRQFIASGIFSAIKRQRNILNFIYQVEMLYYSYVDIQDN